MIRWQPFGPYLTAAFAILASLYYTHTTDSRLQEAREAARTAVYVMHEAVQAADAAETRAQAAEARADSIQAVRLAAHPKVAAAVAAAPDTCRPVIAALEGERDRAVAEAGEARKALAARREATAALRPAAHNLADAATALVKRSRPSFLSRIAPDVGVGAAAGVSVTDRRPDAVIGVTLSWRF